MPAKKKAKAKRTPSIVKSHLGRINRALLEGEKRPAFLEFLRQTDDSRGIYALYDSRDRLHYAGRASVITKKVETSI